MNRSAAGQAYPTDFNSLVAEACGFGLGDELSFETEEGRKQDDSVRSAYRIENQIFTDQGLFEELFGTAGFSSAAIYSSQPERLEALYGEVEEIMGDGMELSASDTLYERLQAPCSR